MPFAGTVSMTGLQTMAANTLLATNVGLGGANVDPLFPLNVKGDSKILGSLTVSSNFSVLGTQTTINSQVIESSNLIINNAGTGPGLQVIQTGAQDIADFADENGSIMKIADSGMITIAGTGSGSLPIKLNVNGTVSATA